MQQVRVLAHSGPRSPGHRAAVPFFTICIASLMVAPWSAFSAQDKPAQPSASAETWPRDVPTFKVNWAIDIPVTVVAGTFAMGWLLGDNLAPAFCAPLCDDAAVPGIDRWAIGKYDTKWSGMSDIVVFSLVGASAVTLGVTESPLAALRDALVIAETALVANALAVVSSLATRRPRPLLYSEAAPLEKREKASAAFSFFSGHTAVAFAVATGMFSLLKRRYPDSVWPWVWLAVSGTAASLVGTGRIMGGDHFLTDVLAGAAVGTSAGFAVPALHDSPPWGVQPVASRGTLGLMLPWM